MRLVRDLGEAPLSVPSHPIPCLSIPPPRCAQFIKEGLEASEQEASPQVPIKPSLPPTDTLAEAPFCVLSRCHSPGPHSGGLPTWDS